MADARKELCSCTKDDLIWIINRVLQMTAIGNQDYYLNRAMSDLRYEKEKRRFDDAEALLDLSIKKQQEAIKLLAKYQDTPLDKIPDGVLERAADLMKESEAADTKWRKVMGLKRGRNDG